MAENKWFNNSEMFAGEENDTTHNDIIAENASEVLATQGNVINSIKVFWNRLRRKLVHAITRNDISEAVGTEYRPVYVDINGEVQPCNGLEKTVNSINNNNINIDNISPIIGTTLYLKVNISSNSNNSLNINNEKVFYPTGVEVTANISANTNLLVVYNGKSWILINKMNEVKTSGKTSESGAGAGDGGYSGLMTADDKAKLDTIKWDANNYTLPTATSSIEGGVKLGADKLSILHTPTASNISNRYYPIQTDKNDKLVVNVPWEDTHEENWVTDLKVGNENYTSNDVTNGNQDTYIKVVENGQVHGKVKVVGSGGTAVSSNTNGELVISSPIPSTYNTLSSSNSSATGKYTINGPGVQNATTNYYLAGNGTWVNGKLVPIGNSSTIGKVLKWGADGPYWDSLPS